MVKTELEMWNWGHGTAQLSQTVASDTGKDFPRAGNRIFSAEKVKEVGKKWEKMGKWEKQNGKCGIGNMVQLSYPKP